jgi:hypothetical protein
LLLIRLREIGAWRHFLRSGRGSKIALLGKLLILSMLLSAAVGWACGVWFSLSVRRDSSLRLLLRSAAQDVAHAATFPMLLCLILMSIFSLFQTPFRFNPTEVNFLLAGPFNRRQLLNLKIGAALSSLVVISLLLAPMGTAVTGLLPAFLGSLLLLNFFHLSSLIAGLLGALLGLQGSGAMRRLVIMLAAVLATLAIVWFSFGKLVNDPIELYRQANHSPVWRSVMAPLRWFIELALAERLWPDMVKWLSLCLFIDGMLLMTIYALDARIQQRADDADGLAAQPDAEGPASDITRRALPLFNRCGGIVPVAWRQAMMVIRKPHQIGVSLIMYGAMVFLLFMLVHYQTGIIFLPSFDGQVEINTVGVRIMGAMGIVLPMLIASGLSFDFRADMGQMDVLKSLPINPIAMSAGQLCVPVLIAAAMQWLAMVVIAIAMRSVPPSLWVAAAFVPAVSVVLMAIENLPSFWFPLRQTPGSKPEPFEALGHILLQPFARVICYGIVVTITLVVSAIAYVLFGQRVAAALIAAWLMLFVEAVGLVAWLARTFDRFDVTQDVQD